MANSQQPIANSPMLIISHRGYWLTKSEKNTKTAFDRSFDLGYGTETDIRDLDGDLVISHDMATGMSMPLGSFFSEHAHNDLLLALNIKADGLQQKLREYLSAHHITNYFVFDMSVPDTISYINAGMPVFSRQSEYEPVVSFYESCKGVWLDAFNDIWYTEELIAGHLSAGKKVAIVSAELHGRDHKTHWQQLKKMSLTASENIILCTDLPEEATAYFNSNQ